MKLAGTVILYNPSYEVIDNILSYLDGVDILYVLDNSENKNLKITNKLKEMSKVYYVAFAENKGISFALNYAIELAQAYEFLLTMDQDSKFKQGEIYIYKTKIEELNIQKSEIAIYTINHMKEKIQVSNKFEYVNDTITSGSIIDIGIAQKVGKFDLNLFIDQVDLEYCYRVRKQGYKIIMFYDLFLIHNLGDPVQYNIFKYSFQVTNHNYLRRYYMMRNMLYVMKMYNDIRKSYIIDIFKMLIKILLFEDDKLKKLYYIGLGINDYIYNKFGKCNY